MIFILEGPDGAGKSTLAKTLNYQTGYKLIHNSAPQSEEEQELMYGMYLQAIKSSKNIIFDRAWYSEMVYGPLLRNKSFISWPQMFTLEKQIVSQGGLIIYCTAPKATLWKRCQDKNDPLIKTRELLNKVYDGFEEIMSSLHHIPVLRYGT